MTKTEVNKLKVVLSFEETRTMKTRKTTGKTRKTVYDGGDKEQTRLR